MHKLSWRIEETTRIRASSCPIHKVNLKRLEAEVTKREIELSKKPIQPIKRYGDIGPRVRVSVALPESVTGGICGNGGNTLRPQSSSTNGNSPMNLLETNALSQTSGVATAAAATTTNADTNASTSTNLLSHHRGGGDGGGGAGEAGEDEDEEGAAFGEEGEEDPNVPFIHPSDDALRQEILQQQRRIREEQLRQEHKFNDSTLFTEEVRILCKSELKSGWKTDFDNNGSIELVTEIDCTALNSGFTNSETFSTTNRSVPSHATSSGTNQPVTLACNMRDPNLGIYVSHILAVEMVVAEETLQYSDGSAVVNGSNSNSATVSPSDEERESRLAEVSPMFATRTPKIRTMFESATSSTGSSANRTTRGTSSSNNTTNGTNDVDGNNSNSNSNNYTNRNTNDTGINSKTGRQNTPSVVFAPTGAARVLRMQFKLNFTERSGLGVSWDDEVPPLYEEVRRVEAPPNYAETVLPPPYASICGQDQALTPESPLLSPCSSPPPPPPHHHHHHHQSVLAPMGLHYLEDRRLSLELAQSNSMPNPALTPPPIAHYHHNHSTSNFARDRDNVNRATSGGSRATLSRPTAIKHIASVGGNLPYSADTSAGSRDGGDVKIQNVFPILDSDSITQ